MRHGSGHLGARLHGRIYLAVLAAVAMTAVLAALAWRIHHGDSLYAESLDLSSEIAAELLPPATAPAWEQESALARWGARTRTSLSLFSSDRILVAAWGEPLPAPSPDRASSAWLHGGPAAPTVLLRLPDGRWLAGRRPGRRPLPVGFLGLLVLAALSVAVAAWPISRRITRRLERLEEGVEALGAGDLTSRVAVEGHDEVALLAATFNRAASRIEELVGAQRSLLANASHELRTPLARLRVAAGLLEGEAHLKVEVARDVVELDELVEEILVASRLDAGALEEPVENVDLTALAAEECARAGARLEGNVVTIAGRPKLLRRLLRNLIGNAKRHGGEGPVEVNVRRIVEGAEVDVLDRGPGVPAALAERVFEPFFRLPGAVDGGAGLGLSIARQIARRHGGDVVCLPRDGGGTLFRATLR